MADVDKDLGEMETTQRETLQAWLATPETQLLLSLLPPQQNETQRDCLQILLRSAHKSGFAQGQITVISKVLLNTLRERRPD